MNFPPPLMPHKSTLAKKRKCPKRPYSNMGPHPNSGIVVKS